MTYARREKSASRNTKEPQVNIYSVTTLQKGGSQFYEQPPCLQEVTSVASALRIHVSAATAVMQNGLTACLMNAAQEAPS